DELPLGCQASQRAMLKDAFISIQIVQHAFLKYEKTGAGPGVRLRLLDEVLHFVFGIDIKESKAGNRAEGRHRREPAVAFMKFEQAANVHVTDAIPVG